jgi:hypothetical protein
MSNATFRQRPRVSKVKKKYKRSLTGTALAKTSLESNQDFFLDQEMATLQS